MGWHGGAVGGAGGRGNLRVAKTPPLQSAFAGRALLGMTQPDIYAT